MKPLLFIVLIGLFVTVPEFIAGPAAAKGSNIDVKTVERLERLIMEQQQLMKEQQRQHQQQLESLQQQLNQLKQAATEAQIQAQEAKSLVQDAQTVGQFPVEKVVTSGEERIKLAISGQVNRAVNVANDGKNTKVYFVDNDTSNSRVRFVGTAKATDDLTLGTRIELAIAPNESSEVSQDNESSGDFFDQRWAEISLESKRFGKLSLGKGSTASDDSAEVDISGVGIIQYSSVSDPAAGLRFREKNSDSLTNVTLFDAFDNLDGLGRRDRIRYDSPALKGFRIAGSAASDQRWDAALRWGGKGYGFKAAGAAAMADPNRDNTDYQYSGSFSLLHESTGLNLTLSAGIKDRSNQGDPTNLYAKLGWLTRFFSFGETGFGIDADRSLNQPTGRDDAYSLSTAVVQQFENYGTEVYAQYRFFSLDRSEQPSVQDIYLGTIGARVVF